MRNFNKIFVALIVMILLLFIFANVFLNTSNSGMNGRPYQVEIARLALEIEGNGTENIDLEDIDLSVYSYVNHIEKMDIEIDSNELSNYNENDCESFYNVGSDYAIREINGEIYRFDYVVSEKSHNVETILAVNIIIAVMSLLLLCVLVFIRQKILIPFERLTDVPYELAKGNLTTPMKENKSRFFGRFVWGVNMLRENMELQKQRELDLHKSRKTLLLSLSHDIKTPVSAIKLYAKALSRGLYSDKESRYEITEKINANADEIEGFVSQIINASREDFLNLEVDMGEFYVSGLINNIWGYYKEKLALIKTDFSVGEYSDCLLKGDLDRSIEVVQNIMENAIKYGDGKSVEITVYDEEGCTLVEVKNSGCTLPQTELPHIFESFWRGSNSEREKGSGLGLYICRQLMGKMGGEIFAQIQDGFMIVTVVFFRA
ncbi:MAG: HAMP domain-containing histidine kinase [Lachnospiraceae bacterium]|nr:HAMP domain-containing histidine kinase [Lachnospiraceae bacterium]